MWKGLAEEMLMENLIMHVPEWSPWCGCPEKRRANRKGSGEDRDEVGEIGLGLLMVGLR